MWSDPKGKKPLRIVGVSAVEDSSPARADDLELADDLQIVAQQLSDDAARLGGLYPAPAFDLAAAEQLSSPRMSRAPVVAAMAVVAALVVTSPTWLAAWRGLAPRWTASPRSAQPLSSAAPVTSILGSVPALAEPYLPSASGPTISFDRLSTSEQEAVLDLLEQQSDPTIGLSL